MVVKFQMLYWLLVKQQKCQEHMTKNKFDLAGFSVGIV